MWELKSYICRPPPRRFLASVASQIFDREYNCMALPNLRTVVRVIELGNSSNLQGTSEKQCKSIPAIPYSMRLILQFNSLPFKSKPNIKIHSNVTHRLVTKIACHLLVYWPLDTMSSPLLKSSVSRRPRQTITESLLLGT